MKRFFLVTFFAVFLALTPIRFVSAGFGSPFQGAILSVFRSAQVFVEEVRIRVGRFLGIRGNAPEAAPSLRLTPFGDFSEFLIGMEREVLWAYENLKESVTRVYLLPEGKPPVLLMFLPAKRNAFGSDRYLFPVHFEQGKYRIQVCNGEACDMTESFFITRAPTEGQSDDALETATSSPISTNTPASSTPATP